MLIQKMIANAEYKERQKKHIHNYCVVEGMAAGNIMIAHNSGGPKMDIVVCQLDPEDSSSSPDDSKKNVVGFLAETSEEYAEHIANVVLMSRSERDVIRSAAREWVQRFSEGEFNRAFVAGFQNILW